MNEFESWWEEWNEGCRTDINGATFVDSYKWVAEKAWDAGSKAMLKTCSKNLAKLLDFDPE